jgi:hypothetical protein
MLGFILTTVFFSGCKALKPTPQDATLATFPHWVQHIFQLPLGASQGFIAVDLNHVKPIFASTSTTVEQGNNILPLPGLAMLAQLNAYTKQPNTPLEPFAYWLMLSSQPTSPNATMTTPPPSLNRQGVWILTLKQPANTSNTTTLAQRLGFTPQAVQTTPNTLFKTNAPIVWQQKAQKIWMTPYPEQETNQLVFASSQQALVQATNRLKQLANSAKAGQLTLQAKLKLVHGLETLYGSATVPATAGITNAGLLIGMPSNSTHWQQLGTAYKQIKVFLLPWQKKGSSTTPPPSWTLLAASQKTDPPAMRTKQTRYHLDFVTPLYSTAEERKIPQSQWLDFIFATSNTNALSVTAPTAIALNHLNEAITVGIETNTFPQWEQPLSMVKPALALLQLDFNKDVLGLVTGETWVAIPNEKTAWLVLQKTPQKKASIDKWVQHLSGKSWLSKILFDRKLQTNPFFEAKTLADGTGTFWAIHLPKTAKNSLLANLPPLGLVEVAHAFVIAPVTDLTKQGAFKALNQAIQPKALPQLGYEPFMTVQLNATQPSSAWLPKLLNNRLNKQISRYYPETNKQAFVPLSVGDMLCVSVGYQPSRGSVRGQIDITSQIK